MNVSPVISYLAAEDLVEHLLVKQTSAGIVKAQPGDLFLGTNLRPVDASQSGKRVADIQLRGCGLNYVTLGDGTDVAVGDALEQGDDGTVVKHTTGTIIGVSFGVATLVGTQFRAVLFPFGSGAILASGIHTWAGGAATTDSIAVAGLEATDVVIATLVARTSTETLVMAANDAGNDQIDLTLSANGANGTTKVSYIVIRP